MLLQILGSFEGFLAEFTFMRLKRNVDADVRGDVVSLDGSSSASAPGARQTEIIGTLTPDMDIAKVVL